MSEETGKIRITDLAAELRVSPRIINELADRAGVDKLGPPMAYIDSATASMIRIEYLKFEAEIAGRTSRGTAHEPPASAPNDGRQFFFASLPSELRLDGWITEEKGRDNGVIIRGSASLNFNDGLFITRDPKQAAFVRNTDDIVVLEGRQFRDGVVFEFDSIDECLRFRREVKAKKQIKEMHSEDVSNSNVDIAAGQKLHDFQAEVSAQAKI